MFGGDLTLRERLPERFGAIQRFGAAFAPRRFFRGDMRVACQHIACWRTPPLGSELVEAVADGGFEAVEQSAQAPRRVQHRDRLGGAERGHVATQNHRQVGMQVVPHPDRLSNIRSIVNSTLKKID
jgi:hypothetical protein